jgi:hypothetical protein
MSLPGEQTPYPPRPQWRGTVALLSLLFVTLCLCVLVAGVSGRENGVAGKILRRAADLPLVGRLVQPLLRSTPTSEAPSIKAVEPPKVLPPSPTPGPHPYLVRPANWPAEWPWPPKSRDQPAAAPAIQPTTAPAAQPTVAPAEEPTLSPEEQKELLEPDENGPAG